MLRALLYLDKSNYEAAHQELKSDRRVEWTVMTSHREVKRRMERLAPDALVLFGERAGELADVLASEHLLGANTLIYLAERDKLVPNGVPVFRYLEHTTGYRTLSSDVLCDLCIVRSTIEKTDLIQRAKAIQSPTVGFLCASTGGPRVIERVIAELSLSGQALVILQHMGEHFVPDFVRRLNQQAKHPLEIVAQDMELRPGRIYIPDGGHHLLIYRDQNRIMLRSVRMKALDTFTPSIDFTLLSAAAHLQNTCVVTILTGMGEDGAVGARALKSRQSRVLCQNPELSSVPSMPRATLETGCAQMVARDEDLPSSIMEAFGHVDSAA